MVTENRRKNCCFLLFNPIIAQICTVCNSICKKNRKITKKIRYSDWIRCTRFGSSVSRCYLLQEQVENDVCSEFDSTANKHTQQNQSEQAAHTTHLFLKKTTGFLFSYKCIVSFQLFKNDKTADFFAQKQTQTESLCELFFRILFLHLLIGVCLIIKYSIVRLLSCFCWLLHIVYDVWTGTPYQCRCAGCSRLFAGITTPVLIKIHCTMSRMFVSVRMMESQCSNYTIVLRFGFVSQNTFLRYFGANTMWYLQFHFECDKLCMSFTL